MLLNFQKKGQTDTEIAIRKAITLPPDTHTSQNNHPRCRSLFHKFPLSSISYPSLHLDRYN